MSTSFHASRPAKAQHSAASATKQGLALLIVAGVLWGTGGPAGSLLQTLTHIHPLGTASYRLLVGGSLACLVLLAAGKLRHLPRSGAALRRILLAGLLLAFFQTSYFVAVDLIAVSLATLLTIGSIPVFVTVTTCLLERARPRPRLAAAVALSVVGLALLAGFPSVTASRADIAAGVSCALLAGAGFTTLTMVNRRSVPGLGPLAVTALGCLVGGAVLVPLGLAVGMAFTPNPAAVGVLVYLGAVPTALAYLAYFWGSRSAPATAVALAALLEPLTATLRQSRCSASHSPPWGRWGPCCSRRRSYSTTGGPPADERGSGRAAGGTGLRGGRRGGVPAHRPAGGGPLRTCGGHHPGLAGWPYRPARRIFLAFPSSPEALPETVRGSPYSRWRTPEGCPRPRM